MKREHVVLVGALGLLADVITTQIGLKYPEIVEMNPFAHPIAEGATVIFGQTGIFMLGDKMGVDPKITNALALMPASIPFVAALNNLIYIAVAHAKLYPFIECPLLYPEVI